MLNNKTREGFTLVELSFAMLFIGVLSVSIVLIISNTVAAYQRGLTLSRVNSTGTEVSDDMRVSSQDASLKTLLETCTSNIFKVGETNYNPLPTAVGAECINDGAYKYVSVKKTADIEIDGEPYNNVPIYGAFCTGSYSYVWNSGYFKSGNAEFDKTAYVKILYKDKDNPNQDLYLNPNGDDVSVAAPFFRLAKVRDKNRAICVAMVDKTGASYNVSNSVITNEIDVRNIYGSISGEAVELLPENSGLALYDLSVARPAVSTTGDNIFYSVSLILGTTTGGANIMAKGNSCVAPKDQGNGSFDNYCAINKFNFAIQVNGG